MIREKWKLSVIRENVETECDHWGTWELSVIRGNVETECDQVKRETECDQGKRGN